MKKKHWSFVGHVALGSFVIAPPLAPVLTSAAALVAVRHSAWEPPHYPLRVLCVMGAMSLWQPMLPEQQYIRLITTEGQRKQLGAVSC